MLTEAWQALPSDIDTPVLERAMAAPTNFRTNAEYNNFYRARLDYLRVQNTIAVSMEQARAETEQARAETAQIRAETEQIRARTEQLRAKTAQALAREEQALAQSAKLRERLRAAGIDPDGE